MTKKQIKIVETWDTFEEDDPDISTERLMAMVCQHCQVDALDVGDALFASEEEKLKNKLKLKTKT